MEWVVVLSEKKMDAQGIEPWTLYKFQLLECKAYALPLRYAPLHFDFLYLFIPDTVGTVQKA